MHEKFGAGGDDNLLINFTWPYVLYMCIILCETCYLYKCVSLGVCIHCIHCFQNSMDIRINTCSYMNMYTLYYYYQ